VREPRPAKQQLLLSMRGARPAGSRAPAPALLVVAQRDSESGDPRGRVLFVHCASHDACAVTAAQVSTRWRWLPPRATAAASHSSRVSVSRTRRLRCVLVVERRGSWGS
jgi:hypothetical protein